MSPIKFALNSMAALVLLVVAGEADANLVLNGNFTSFTTGPNGQGQLGDYTTLANWTSATNSTGGVSTNLFYQANTADTVGSYNPQNSSYYKLWGPGDGSNNGFTDASPTGGNFVALDGDSMYRGALSQTISGLTANQYYSVTFSWAGAEQYGYSTATSDSLSVSFGSQNQSTATVQNAAEGFTGWMTTTMLFTASGSTDVLSFLSSSTPNGVPPYILLADVSVNFVPEPSSLALLSTGVLAVVGVGLRRRLARSRNA